MRNCHRTNLGIEGPDLNVTALPITNELAWGFPKSISSTLRPISRIRLMIKRKNGFFSYM